MSEQSLSSSYKTIRIQEPADLGVVVTALQVVEPRLGVVDITTVTEGVQGTESACQGFGNSEAFAPTVVRIFYDSAAIAVNQLDNIPLSGADVVVICAVVVHGDHVPVCIIAEQQLVISGDLRDEHRAVVAVAGGRSIDGLLCADAVLVIGIGNGICAVCRAHQPAALPRHRITAISGRIAGSVIADVLAVVTRQLVCSGAACQRLPPRLLFQRFFIPGTMLFYQ